MSYAVNEKIRLNLLQIQRCQDEELTAGLFGELWTKPSLIGAGAHWIRKRVTKGNELFRAVFGPLKPAGEAVKEAVAGTITLLEGKVVELRKEILAYESAVKQGKVKIGGWHSAKKAVRTWERCFYQVLPDANAWRLLLEKMTALALPSPTLQVDIKDTLARYEKHNAVFSLEQQLGYRSAVNNSFPGGALKKIVERKKLSATDKEAISDLARRLSWFKKSIPLSFLWKALAAWVALYTAADWKAVHKIAEVLEKDNFCIYDREDAHYCSWVEELRSGAITTVQVGEVSYRLKGEVVDHVDGALSFSIKDNPHAVLRVSRRNPFHLMRDLLPDGTPSCSLATPRTQEFDSSVGCAAVIDRLTPLHLDSGTEEGKKVVEAVSTFIKNMVQKQLMPQGITAAQLMLRSDQKLSLTHPLPQVPFSFSTIEALVWDLAHHLPSLYKPLMYETGLLNDITARYYYQVVRFSLESAPFDCGVFALQSGFTNREAIIQGALLQREVQTIRDSVILLSSVGKEEKVIKAIEQVAPQIIAKLYNDDCSASKLFPSLLLRAKEEVERAVNL